MINLREEYKIELPRAKGAYLEEAPEEIWENLNYCLEVKMDGTRESLQIGSENSLLVGRNRQGFLRGVENAKGFQIHDHPIFSKIACPALDGTILDGELTLSYTKDGELDSLTKDRQKLGIFTGYTVWGCLFYKGKDVRRCMDSERRHYAENAVKVLNHPQIRLIERFPATREKLQEIWDAGEEGAIAKLTTGCLIKGQRTCPTWWKLKTAQTIDAFVFGVTEGKEGGSGVKGVKALPNGKAASLTVCMIGKTPNDEKVVGKVKNLPDEITDDAFRNFEKYRYRVMELRASGWNGKSFRWLRFLRWREDKSPKDCIFSEQVGGNE